MTTLECKGKGVSQINQRSSATKYHACQTSGLHKLPHAHRATRQFWFTHLKWTILTKILYNYKTYMFHHAWWHMPLLQNSGGRNRTAS